MFGSILNEYTYNQNEALEEYELMNGYDFVAGINYCYDEVNRLKSKAYWCKGLDLEVSYEYKDRNSTLTTVQVSKYTSKVNDVTSAEYTYTYDSRGNITKITDSAGNITKYTYDDLSQLTREDNPYLNKTYLYTYDNAGNRTSKKTYTYTTGSLASLTPTSTQAYTYSTGAWGDRLSGTTYDGIGNPLTYSTYALTWSGHELKKAGYTITLAEAYSSAVVLIEEVPS